jgi:DNA helicase II / ATP-dependent DNA helicase PcrA
MNETNLLVNLNPEQQQIVCAPLTHLAVIAGAGSGKTRVLVHRIAWLIQKEQVPYHGILAVTFTNKAAGELRDRVEKLTHVSVRNMWLGTFHGLAHRFLRLHWKQASLPETFQILDADDQYRLIKKVHHELHLDADKWPPQQSQWYINNQKDKCLRPQNISARSRTEEILLRIYSSYEEHCTRSGLVDFAELLLRSYEVLLANKDLLDHYQAHFAHILVDEFQDTNAIQYAWLKLIAGRQATLMIVGDDDQSIYSWRGAQIENIYKFRHDFPSQVIRLEQNYRSTKIILAAANAVIAHNPNRYGKNLWTHGQEGNLIPLYRAFNEIDEAKFIVSEIKSLKGEGFPLKEIAVLYRSNAQSRILEEELLRANLPYRIYGGLRFFERAEIKDALAYLRLIANPFDDSAYERAVNMPPRSIGNTTLNLVRDYASTENIALWQASEVMISKGILTSRATHALSGFLQLIEQFREEIRHWPLDVQTKHIIYQSGLYEYYSKDRSDKTQSRLENLTELILATQQFQVGNSPTLSPLQDFLSHVALESGENQAEIHEDSVQLMTLHSAKGLEFEIVFLSGMEEGLFPHKMSIGEPGRLEEERRLCYVGMTRARKKLFLSCAEARRVNGRQIYSFNSRFIDEIPNDLLNEIRVRAKISQPSQFLKPRFIPHDTGINYQLGERVLHKAFGEGIVLNYEGQGEQARVQIKFHKLGTKWLMVDLANLVKL